MRIQRADLLKPHPFQSFIWVRLRQQISAFEMTAQMTQHAKLFSAGLIWDPSFGSWRWGKLWKHGWNVAAGMEACSQAIVMSGHLDIRGPKKITQELFTVTHKAFLLDRALWVLLSKMRRWLLCWCCLWVCTGLRMWEGDSTELLRTGSQGLISWLSPWKLMAD